MRVFVCIHTEQRRKTKHCACASREKSTERNVAVGARIQKDGEDYVVDVGLKK